MRSLAGGFVALVMIVSAASAAAPQTSQKKADTAKRPVAAKKPVVANKPVVAKPLTSLQKGVAKKRAVTSASTRSAAGHQKTPAKPAVTWRNRQLQPTQDRYKEIQTALASKGYLQPERATGAWDQNSADAMKQFQAAQNLDASGKINSLSLIALGLGPKHDAAPAPPVQPSDQSR
jgi:Putative peptidoglycan binding domain